MCCMDRYGFPRTKAKGAKQVKGFQTGDIVKAIVPTGKCQGTYTGRVAVRTSGSFDIKSGDHKITTSWKYCKKIQATDGYAYHVQL